MSIWLGVVRRQAALDDPESPLCALRAHMQASREAFLERVRQERGAKPAERRRWPERKAFAHAEQTYAAELHRVRHGGTATCPHCKEARPAACFGAYEGGAPGYACGECCGHGNEDGWCHPVEEPRPCLRTLGPAASAIVKPHEIGDEWREGFLAILPDSGVRRVDAVFDDGRARAVDDNGTPYALPVAERMLAVGWCRPCDPFSTFTITHGTADYGERYVVRRWLCTTPLAAIDPPLAVVDTLEEARAAVPAECVRTEPAPGDDPVIVEVWL